MSPVERGPGGSLPRWVTDPCAEDFAGPELLAFEAARGSQGDGLTGWIRPVNRLQHALDLFYGKDQWDMQLGRMAWPGRWTPGRAYDPDAYERRPGGPPDGLRRLVAGWQEDDDAMMREVIRRNSFAEYTEERLLHSGIPPEGQAYL